MLAQTESLRHESLQVGCTNLVIEDAKVSVAHIVGNDQNDVCLLCQLTAFLLGKRPVRCGTATGSYTAYSLVSIITLELWQEVTSVHGLEIRCDVRLKVHICDDVPLDIHSWRNFAREQPVADQLEDHFLVLCVILMKPPQPAIILPTLLTLPLPSRSTCAIPRNAVSSPPPS